MSIRLETEAEHEIVAFLARQPTPQNILAYHPSATINDRYYALVDAERAGALSDSEQSELENYLYVEHFIRLLKTEARKQLGQQDQALV